MSKSQRAVYEGKILPRERDLRLQLSDPSWPEGNCPLGAEGGESPPAGAEPWQRNPGFLYRSITVEREPLWEVMLRFPSAPLYGLHQSPPRFPRIENRSNFHTLRVIGTLPKTPKDQPLPRERIRDVYLFHNGLNETGEADLHYQLASRLLVHSESPAVCILRPFPGHLTRYPYNDIYAEQPLDTYLLDSGDLFRQFIRFMVETRWLLSILTPRPAYRVITGGTLVDCGRPHDSEALAGRIVGEWEEMDGASVEMDGEMPEHARRPQADPQDVTVAAVKTTIDVLRDELLRWWAEMMVVPCVAIASSFWALLDFVGVLSKQVQSFGVASFETRFDSYAAVPGVVDTWLFDSGAGSGKSFDWQSARKQLGDRQGQFVVAGGLNPENVGDAIRTFRPWGVDVVSGVEREPGRKDPEKLKAFVAAVRKAEQI